MNARKAVESVCLDVLINWRGDEETGRDQLDELLREVIIITDSENEDDSTSDDDTSSEEGEVTAVSSPETPSQLISRPQPHSIVPGNASKSRNMDIMDLTDDIPATTTISSRTRSKGQKDKKAQRGFKRYQAAWEDARNRRQQGLAEMPIAEHSRRADNNEPYRRPPSNLQLTNRGPQFQPLSEIPRPQHDRRLYQEQGRYDQPVLATRPVSITLSTKTFFSTFLLVLMKPGPNSYLF